MGSGSSKSAPAAADLEEPWELYTYLPPYDVQFEYSHTHFLYTNDLAKLDDLPPPHTSPTRKSEIFDPDKFKHVDDKTDAIPKSLIQKPMSQLTKQLTGGYSDSLSKVRAIYRWITSQPVETSNYKQGASSDTAMFHLWHLKDKRTTYAAFFSLLCWYSHIPCATIRGFLKGSTYEVGQKINKDTHRGEWNAVLIDGNWRFINAFWGACVLAGDNQQDYWYTCDENFFLTDPGQLIFTHFPEESAWQLLDTKKTLREFETMAFLKDRFFNLEMRVLTHPECNIVANNGEVEILFGLHPDKSANQTFLCIPTIFDNENNHSTPIELPQKNVQLDFIHRTNENVLSVKVRFPAVGTYKLEIVGKDITVTNPDYDFDWVAIYKANVTSVPKKQVFFPVLEPAGWGPSKILEEFGLEAVSHKSGVIEVSPGPLEIKFKVVNPERAAQLNLEHKVLSLDETEDVVDMASDGFKKNGDLLTLSVDVREGDYKMMISHVFGEGHVRNICNYHVVCKGSKPAPKEEKKEAPKPVAPPRDHVGELRTLLREAITSQELEKLERAVDMVESRGFANKLHDELQEAKDLITRLRRLQKLIHEVMTLNQRTIAEIRSYSHPKEEIHTVMKATLLLLGNPENETKVWPNVQALIGKTGKQSLKRRIQELDVNKLSPDTVRSAKEMLGTIKLEDVVVISSGAATFFNWSNGITEEFLRRRDPAQTQEKRNVL